MHNPFSKIFGNTLAGIVVVSLLGAANPTHADICVKGVNKVVSGKIITFLSKVTRSGRCKKGEIAAITGPKGATGPAGPTGPSGVDGQLRIYGDGSGGAKTVAANETLSDPVAMYTDVVINSGVTFTVPSGTVIRCTGSFVNNGTLLIQSGAPGGDADASPFCIPAAS
jgi:hypothetical protein